MNGQLRGKRGGVVYTRMDGNQISRARNFNPKNPKTNKQLLQRAVMATVMQAYSEGKAIFDHSFEGFSVGAQNQRRFMSLNAKRLRAALAEDLNAGYAGAACAGRFVGPGVSDSVPFQYVVSEGTLTQNIFDLIGKVKSTTYSAGDKLSDFLANNDIDAGDIFTFIFMQTGGRVVFQVSGNDADTAKQKSTQFSYVQLKVKSGLTSTVLNTDITEVTYGDLFDVVEVNYVDFDATDLITEGIYGGDNLPYEGSLFAAGVIRSKENEGLRSSCVLEYPTYISQWSADWGLTSDVVLQAWKQGSDNVGQSSLILEGVNFTTGE